MARPKKPVNTFEAYQQERQDVRVLHIEAYLKAAKNSRASFKYVTDLAEMVATHLTQVEGKKCNRSTLLRNPKYKALLLSYMAGDVVAGVKNVKSKKAESPQAQALAIHSELRISNLERENERLKAYVSDLKSQVSQSEPPRISSDKGSSDATKKAAENEVSFIKTCQVLLRVLESSDGLLSVDFETERLLDASRRVDNIIADKQLAAPFIAWLRANKTR